MTVNTNNSGLQATINMTPMIDVLLVLLIIFMAIAPTRQSGLDAVIPQTPSADASPDNPIVLEIGDNGAFRLNSQSVDRAALQNRLTSIFERRANRVLFIKAADTLDYSVITAAVDTARGAKIDRVAFMPR